MSGEDDKEFKELLAQLQASPDATELIDKLPLDMLNKLNKQLSPYEQELEDLKNKPKKAVLLSLTHLSSDYIQRLTTTGMIGFLFAVSKEHEFPPEIKRWQPEVKSGDKPNEAEPVKAPKREPFTIDKTISKLEKLLDLAKSVKTEMGELKNVRQMLHTELAVTGGKLSEAAKGLVLAEKQREERRLVLEYLVTHELRTAGIDADCDMDETLEKVKTLPEAKDLLEKHPPRKVVWQPRNFTYEVPNYVCRAIVKDFLNKWFSFDPNEHVRSGHNEQKINRDSSDDHRVDLKDPARPTKTAVQQKPKVDPTDTQDYSRVAGDKRSKDAVLHVLRDPELLDFAVRCSKDKDLSDRFRRYLAFIPLDSPARTAIDVVPPQDTYHRFNYYLDVNYEEMRSAVEALYDVKPDLEDAIFPYHVIEGTDEDIEKQRRDYLIKNQDSLRSDVLAVNFGAWNLIGSFKKNRDKIDYYNKNTEIIKRIMDRIESDKSIGKELMKQRVVKKKAENIRQAGPDAPGLTQYRGENKEIMALGAQKVLDREATLRLEKAQGNVKAIKELEYLEQREKRKNELAEIKKSREWTMQEERENREVDKEIAQARELMNAPEDTVQVDVFTHNATTGDFTKAPMYTKAEAPTFMEDNKKEQMKMLQNSGLAMMPGPHQALMTGPAETKKDDKKKA